MDRPVLPGVQHFGIDLEAGVHMSFTVVMGMVLRMVRASLGWTWNARHKLQ